MLILVGLALALFLGWSAFLRLASMDSSLLGLLLEIPLIVLGVAAVAAGIRALMNGK